MRQTRQFYEDWCDGKMLGSGSFIGSNSGENWDFSRYEEQGGFQIITLSSNRESTILICDNSHRWWEYSSAVLEIPWHLLNEDEGLLEREKQRLVAQCKEDFARRFPHEAAEEEAN